MNKGVANLSEESVATLLSNHPKGMDIFAISNELNSEVGVVKPLLVQMQNKNSISSGLKKFEGKPSFFMRYYFLL